MEVASWIAWTVEDGKHGKYTLNAGSLCFKLILTVFFAVSQKGYKASFGCLFEGGLMLYFYESIFQQGFCTLLLVNPDLRSEFRWDDDSNG